MAASRPHPVLVDPAVSRRKLEREIEAWRQKEAEYRARGFLLLRDDLDDLVVEIAFLALIPMGNPPVAIVRPAIRLQYDNYDLWPPSLTFIDVFSGRPCFVPPNEALMPGADGLMRNVLMHDSRGKPFLCLRGTREYHAHPDHSGDMWALYRSQKQGAIAVIAERIYETMTSLVAGVAFQMQAALLTPSAELPIRQAQQMARESRAAYDAQVTAQAIQFGADSG